MTTATNQTETLGKLISTQDGHTGGPCYGECYTAPAGEHGYIAGYRRHDAAGLGLIGRKWFASKKDALDYMVQVTS